MSALLDIVQESRQLLLDAEREWKRALKNARAGGHTLQEIGAAAGITKQSVSKALRKEQRSWQPEEE